MLKLTNLFSLLVTLCFLASCEKHESETIQNIEADISEINIKAVQTSNLPYPSGPLFFEKHAYVGCLSGFGFCSNPVPFTPNDFPLEILAQENVGLANIHANENSLVFEVDASTLGDSFITGIIETSTFNVSKDVKLSSELLNQIYETSELPTPTEISIPSGNYPVNIKKNVETGTISIIVTIVTKDTIVVLKITFYEKK